MKKKVFGRKLSRSRPAREALFASMIRSMLLNGKIVTTRAKAKAVQPDLEKIVTVAKKGELSGRRRVLAMLDNAKDAVEVLYKNVVPSFIKRGSGYSRLVSLPPRKGDAAQMVRIEWMDKIEVATSFAKATEGKQASKALKAEVTGKANKKSVKTKEKAK